MERSAINTYSAAGATIGVLVGLCVANLLIGTGNPEFFYLLTGILAMPFAAGAYFLVSRGFRRAGKRQQLFLAVSGWIAFVASVAGLVLVVEAVFPKAIAAWQCVQTDPVSRHGLAQTSVSAHDSRVQQTLGIYAFVSTPDFGLW